MKITTLMRTRYHPSNRAHNSDAIIRLCDLCDQLEGIVRQMQHRLPEDQQNVIEMQLLTIDKL